MTNGFAGWSCNKCPSKTGEELLNAGRSTNYEYKVDSDGTVTYVQHYSCGHVDDFNPRKPFMRHGELYHDHDNKGNHPIRIRHRK